MKVKKENKGLAIYNCRIYFKNDEVNYVTRDKGYRIQFNDRIYLNWRKSWFIYKNLELTYWREYIIFALI